MSSDATGREALARRYHHDGVSLIAVQKTVNREVVEWMEHVTTSSTWPPRVRPLT